jgi:hypothetical protein
MRLTDGTISPVANIVNRFSFAFCELSVSRCRNRVAAFVFTILQKSFSGDAQASEVTACCRTFRPDHSGSDQSMAGWIPLQPGESP